MINKRDLEESIAELEGARNHSPQMCQQLASLYIIREKLFNQSTTPDYGYSMASAPIELTPPESRSLNETNPRKETYSMSRIMASSGNNAGSEYMPMTKQMAMEWAKNLENEDGSRGPHWSMDQTNTVMAQKHIEADPVEFFLAMNLTYSDLCKEFKKHGINNMDAYVDFAKAFWLNDRDVGEDKIAKYYQMIAK